MKTAMQEFIEKVEHAISYNVEGGLVEKYTWTELFNDMEKALEKEKEQMIGCCLVGYLFDENGDINPFEEAEKFYNQTYNQNK